MFHVQEYKYGGWWKPGGYLEEWRNAFCSYDLPDAYAFKFFRHHFFVPDKHLLMYQREDTKQWLALLQLPEHPKIAFEQVRHKLVEDLRAVQPGYSVFPPELGMTPRTLIPLFMTDDIAAGSDGLILRGIQVLRQERLTTRL